jgi:hypothetical protein
MDNESNFPSFLIGFTSEYLIGSAGDCNKSLNARPWSVDRRVTTYLLLATVVMLFVSLVLSFRKHESHTRCGFPGLGASCAIKALRELQAWQ